MYSLKNNLRYKFQLWILAFLLLCFYFNLKKICFLKVLFSFAFLIANLIKKNNNILYFEVFFIFFYTVKKKSNLKTSKVNMDD